MRHAPIQIVRFSVLARGACRPQYGKLEIVRLSWRFGRTLLDAYCANLRTAAVIAGTAVWNAGNAVASMGQRATKQAAARTSSGTQSRWTGRTPNSPGSA